jgi:hypothetical protein
MNPNQSFILRVRRVPRVPRRRSIALPAALALVALAAALPRLEADALLEETHPIVAGWNFIRVGVDPVERDPDLALAGIDWVSLWTWIPSAPPETGGRWASFHRQQPAFLNTLQQLTGPRSYAILARASGALRVTGAWRQDRQSLRGGTFQLYSPMVPASSPPTLGAFLSRPDFRERFGPLFERSGNGYRQLNDNDLLRRGKAYWALPGRDLDAPDPLVIGTGSEGLHFSAQSALQELEIKVSPSDAARDVQVRALAAADPSGSTEWIEVQLPDGSLEALGAGAVVPIEPGQTSARVVLGARNGVATLPAGTFKSALIEVSSAVGSTLLGAELEVPAVRGLWIGEVQLSEVERPSFHGGGYAPAAKLPLSVILEIPSSGSPRLLPCLQIEADRNGRKIAYRLEAALFPQAVQLSGSVGDDAKSGVLSGSLPLPAAHPLNPYRHRYHPEHVLGYDIGRTVKLRFGAQIPQDPAVLDLFGSVGTASGVYEEELTGLSREPIRVRGAFRLRQLPEGAAAPCAAGQ